MKLKLTELQKHKIQSSSRDLSSVLQEIKNKSLSGEALTDMKMLEQAVQHLEIFTLGK